MNGKGLWGNNQCLKLSPLLGVGVLWNTFYSSSFNHCSVRSQLQPLYKSMSDVCFREDGPSNGLWFNHRLLRLKLLLENWLFIVILLRNKHFVNLVNLPVNRASSLYQQLVYRSQIRGIFVHFIRGPCYDVSSPLEIVFIERLAPLIVYNFTVYYH